MMRLPSVFLFFILIHATPGLTQSTTNYFQQEVHYTIHVKLNDVEHELDANISIDYTNNSPSSLTKLYFHLWPNAYKSNTTALAQQLLEEGRTEMHYVHKEALGNISELAFAVNGDMAQWQYDSAHADIAIIHLNEPLKPSEKLTITTPFRIDIPSGEISRLGHIGQSYQITQWYPKPAVFDTNGWHPMPYLNQGEFYAEFGTFDVFITLPKNYVVGATGNLVDSPNELEWLNQKAEATAKINSFDLYNNAFPTSSDTMKTLHYHQENIHDFAWFADKRYHVLKGEVTLPHHKNKVTTWAMFTNSEANLWKNAITYLNDATYYYSLWNGDYPYNQVTAVDGTISAGGGMEYPTITVIGESFNAFSLERVIVHEVGHNWFYGILGSNERQHPWMDEGINTANENRYIATKYPNRKLLGNDSSRLEHTIANFMDLKDYSFKTEHELSYLWNARKNKDQPIETWSENYTPMNYGGIVYSKTGLIFEYLMAYLGEELYDRCMQNYFSTWKFKHPQPDDLRRIFEQETQKDLSWFFDDLIKTTKKIDYKIIHVKSMDNDSTVSIKITNQGKVSGPFSISGIGNGKVIKTQWYDPFQTKKRNVTFYTSGNIDTYKIDAAQAIPEVNRKNNTLRSKGLLKTIEPLRFQPIISLENPNKTQLFFSPLLGWNANDRLMAGMAFYNSFIPSKRMTYLIAPLYAFGSKRTNGYANLHYHILPQSIFEDITIGVNSASFSFFDISDYVLAYYKVAPEIQFHFRKKRPRQHTASKLTYSANQLWEERRVDLTGNRNADIKTGSILIHQLELEIKNTHPINPYDIKVEMQQKNTFTKLNLTANYRFAYKKRNTGLDLRLFAGRFLNNKNASENNAFNYNMSGGDNADYLYKEVYLGRNTSTGVINQQFYVNDGGFKNATGVVANRWLTAINLKSNLFFPFLGIYADAGWAGSTLGSGDIRKSGLVTDAGFSLNIIPKFFEIYFPIHMSSDLNQLTYGEKIRFTLNISNLKPFERIRNFEL